MADKMTGSMASNMVGNMANDIDNNMDNDMDNNAQATVGLELTDVSLSINAKRLFAPVTLVVRPDKAAAIMGPSGCGKSSLLAHICGTLPPIFSSTGAVRLNGRDLAGTPPEARRTGILFQDALLFPHLSVGENLAFGLPADVHGRSARRDAIEEALKEADLSGMADRDPATLSGGQQARIAVMRTLLSSPAALLLDEPFSKLDADLRAWFRDFVFDHARRRHIPTLLVTHDPADADATGGPVIELTE
jgi:putative thiamine transport system ATP-binding protein